MKLYYMPGACSLASHIALSEAGADFLIERVDGATKQTEAGSDFRQVNPNGYVPALQLDDGEILTEGVAILQYVADRYPGAALAPEAGTIERTRLQQHLNYIASEYHKAFRPFFVPGTSDAAKEEAAANVSARLDYLESVLSDGRQYLVGNAFSVADAYLFVICGWLAATPLNLDSWPNVAALCGRVAAREKVQRAMSAEGLLNQ